MFCAVSPDTCHCYVFYLSAPSLTSDAILDHLTSKTIVQAFITWHLDSCNSLLYGVPENLLRKVKSALQINAAARLFTNTRRRDLTTSLRCCVNLAACVLLLKDQPDTWLPVTASPYFGILQRRQTPQKCQKNAHGQHSMIMAKQVNGNTIIYIN